MYFMSIDEKLWTQYFGHNDCLMIEPYLPIVGLVIFILVIVYRFFSRQKKKRSPNRNITDERLPDVSLIRNPSDPLRFNYLVLCQIYSPPVVQVVIVNLGQTVRCVYGPSYGRTSGCRNTDRIITKLTYCTDVFLRYTALRSSGHKIEGRRKLYFNDRTVRLRSRIARPGKEEILTCYVDGSYSHSMKIGHSGFRSSDGSSQVSRYFPQRMRNGSTESEVFAAFLAIRYALKNHYPSLLIYTDNSKVEQLLKRPKHEDQNRYAYFMDTLNRYQQRNGALAICVKRIRGHPTRQEQELSLVNKEFAKTDRLVRRKTRHYVQRKRQQMIYFSYVYSSYYYLWLIDYYSSDLYR